MLLMCGVSVLGPRADQGWGNARAAEQGLGWTLGLAGGADQGVEDSELPVNRKTPENGRTQMLLRE